MIASLSDSQEKLIAFLRFREERHLPAPTNREICEELGFKSTNATHKLLSTLESLGLIKRDPGLARSIRLVAKLETGVPLLGSIAAGFPSAESEEVQDRLKIDPCAFGISNPSDAFALRVRGDSMIGKHFFDGDLVLLDRSAIAKDQDVVAALIDQECTLKTLVLKKRKAWLKAENPAYPELIPAHDLQIQGVAKAVIRIIAA